MMRTMNLLKGRAVFGKNTNPVVLALQKRVMISPFVTVQNSFLKQKPIVTTMSIRNAYDVPTFKDTTPAAKTLRFHDDEAVAADHLGRQQNHIWSKEEIDDRLKNLYRHQPKNVTDFVMNRLVILSLTVLNFIIFLTKNVHHRCTRCIIRSTS